MDQEIINHFVEEITSMRKQLARMQKIIEKEKQPTELLNKIDELRKENKTLENSNEDLIARNYILTTKQKWVPCYLMLPDDDRAVLVWCADVQNIYCAFRHENRWWIFGAFDQEVIGDVTAWMPSPAGYEENIFI